MKRYRLLVAWQLWPLIQAMTARQRRTLYRLFDRLEEQPDAVSEFQSPDPSGRTLDGFIFGDLAFYYWIDFADRHVKVVAIGPADRIGRD